MARGLVALAQREFEKAGREFGEVGEEGGLGDWEGQVGWIGLGDIQISVQRPTCLPAVSDRCRYGWTSD